jgi:uncharacterized membrane protein
MDKIEVRQLWNQRIVLFLFIAAISFFWASSFLSVAPFGKVLNHKLVMFGALSLLIGSAVLYARSCCVLFFEKHQWWIVGCLFVFYSVAMSVISILKHYSFQTHAFDLAIFDQAIWSTVHGKFLYSSFKEGICLLGDHMSPILILFVPIYWIWEDVRVLLISQALISAACLFPLVLIAQEQLGKGLAPLVFAVAFFFYQPLRHSIRSDFHPEIWANLLSFLAFYFMLKKKDLLFFITLLFLVACKENMYGISFIFGIFLVFKRRIKMGTALIVLSVLFFYLTTRFLMPQLAGGKGYFYGANYNYLFTGNWGDHPPLIVQPLDLLEYLYKIFIPLGGLSFLHPPTLLLTVPILFQNILSRNPYMHSIAFQYTSGLTPFVFISAIYGLDVLMKYVNKKGFQKRWVGLPFTAVVLLSLALAGRPERQYFFNYKTDLNQHKKAVRSLLKQIPNRFSIVANERLAPHLSHRFELRQFEDFQRMPQAPTYPLESDLVVLDREVMTGDMASEIKKVQVSGYQILYEKNGFYILGREPFKDLIRS